MNLNKIMEYINKMTSKKNAYNLIVVLLVGVLLIIVSSFFKSADATAVSTTNQTTQEPSFGNGGISSQNEDEKKAEAELENLLSQIKGIGKVKVGLTFDSDGEYVPAINDSTSKTVTNVKDSENGQSTTTQSTDGTTVVMSNDGSSSEPFILKKIAPKVVGALIVAQGAENDAVRSSIVAAVSSLFAIPNYEIQVFPMK